MPNGIYHFLSIRPVHLRSRVVRLYLHFYQNSNITYCKQTVKTLIRSRVLRRLIWVCTVCLCYTKRTLGLNGLKALRGKFLVPLFHTGHESPRFVFFFLIRGEGGIREVSLIFFSNRDVLRVSPDSDTLSLRIFGGIGSIRLKSRKNSLRLAK